VQIGDDVTRFNTNAVKNPEVDKGLDIDGTVCFFK
jgi:hypothetical protein